MDRKAQASAVLLDASLTGALTFAGKHHTLLNCACMHCIPASCLQLACNACMHHVCNLAHFHACSCIDEEGACMKNHMQACSCIDEEDACMKNHMQACMKSEACMHYSHHCMHKNGMHA